MLSPWAWMPRPDLQGSSLFGTAIRAGWALALLIALGLAVAFSWSSSAEHRAIEGLDPVQRRAVYEQAFGELQRLCGAGPRNDALEKRCLAQVQFVLKFPECDARLPGNRAKPHPPAHQVRLAMADLALAAATLAFFLLAVLFVRALDRS